MGVSPQEQCLVIFPLVLSILTTVACHFGLHVPRETLDLSGDWDFKFPSDVGCMERQSVVTKKPGEIGDVMNTQNNTRLVLKSQLG